MQKEKIGLKIYGANSEEGLIELGRLLDYINQIGYDFIEIRPDEFDLIICGHINRPHLENLRKLLSNYSFEIVVHSPLRLNLFNREYTVLHERVFEATLEICCFLNSNKCVYHPGRYIDNNEFPRFGKPSISQEKKKELMKMEREKIIKYSEKFKDINITIENHRPYLDYAPYSYGEFIDELIEQVKKINKKNVNIALDTGHLNLSANYHKFDIIDALKKIKKYTKHVHLQDNHGIASFYTEKEKGEMLPFGRGDEHMIPGEGNFPFKDFFSLFNDYEDTYTIELATRYLNQNTIKEAFLRVKNMIFEGKVNGTAK